MDVRPFSATMHCLSGCLVGEVMGLTIGVFLQWPAWQTICLATALAYVSGYALALYPIVSKKIGLLGAIKTIWLAETISIGIMELAMNSVDYLIGGVDAGSVFEPIFWIGLAFAVLAGFLIGYPANFFLIKHGLKRACR
ncbi:MAG: DUF4396 domain-containing protein [Kordiimonadaceae bacterium]|nr:DUF4396 domain-containing protein [Kordiimonadaceae bacterium]